MPVQSKIDGCYETVIAAMASRIESLQDELNWKQKRIDQLELHNEAMRIRLGEDKPPKRPSDMLFQPASLIDSDRDPFEGVEGK